MHKLFCLFLFLSAAAFGQVQPDKLLANISNVKTARHITIPGTRLFIVPPAGFQPATTFNGLQKGEGAMIMVMDLVGGNFYTNAATFSRIAFEQKGIKVLDFQESKVNGFPAKCLVAQDGQGNREYLLVFGDTTFSTMVTAACADRDEGTIKELVHALNSIGYSKSKKVDPFETARFSLDDKASRFRFARYSANVYLYAPGGVDNMNDKDAPKVLVSQLPRTDDMSARSVADMMLASMQQHGLTSPEIKKPVDARH